jgi:AcrR family transcriptional regulator
MGVVQMDRQPSRRERKKRKTRQRLLECAWHRFLQNGYDETTVEDITEAADVAKGTFFNYFSTKEAVLDELALWRLELLGQQIQADVGVSPESETQPAIARIKRMVCALAGEFFPESDLPRHLLLARISAPIKHQSAHRLGSMTRELVEQGQQTGEIRADMDADMIARLIMTAVFYHFMCAHPEHPHSEHAHREYTRADHVDVASARPTPPQPARTRASLLDQTRTSSFGQKPNTQYAIDLEARLIESIDQLLDGLGGPDWRRQ